MESRIKHSSRNAVFAVTQHLIRIILTFVVRTVFIRVIGVELLGLNSLFANILQLLSIAELGIGQAIIFSMYKPVAEGDTEKIKSLLSLYKKLYFTVGIVVIVIGLAMLPFLHHFIQGTPPAGIDIRIVFSAFLAQTSVGYFFAYKRALIFAHQRNDVENKILSFSSILLNVVQIILILTTRNYYLFVFMLPAAALIEGIMIFVVARKMYPEIRGKSQKLSREEKKLIAGNTGAQSIHRVGAVIIFGAGSIIISSILGLEILGFYANYLLITNAVASFIGLFATALRGSIGNLVATSEPEKMHKIFGRMNFLFLAIIGFCTICLFILLQPFIGVWLGENYVLNFWIMVLLVVHFYLKKARQIPLAFKDTAGIFKQDLFKVFLEIAIMLPLAIVLTLFMPQEFALMGVIIASIASTILAPFWVEPWVVYKYLFKQSSREYFIKYLVYTLVTLGIGAIVFLATWWLPAGGIGWFILKAGITVCLTAILYILVYFKTNHFQYFWALAKRAPILRKFFKPPAAPAETAD